MKKSLICSIGALSLTALVGIGALLCNNAAPIRETKAVDTTYDYNGVYQFTSDLVYFADDTLQAEIYGDFLVIVKDTDYNHQLTGSTLSYNIDSLSSRTLTLIRPATDTLNEQTYLIWEYDADNDTFTWYQDRSYSDITIEVDSLNNDSISKWEVFANRDLQPLDSLFFTFAKNFNYNAFYQQTEPLNFVVNRSKSAFISGVGCPSSVDDLQKDYIFEVGLFKSNGYYFNKVIVQFDYTMALDYYQDNSGTLIHPTNTSDDWTTWTDITFVRMAYQFDDNTAVQVCGRELGFYGGDTAYRPYTASWVNDDYRNIEFLAINTFREINRRTIVDIFAMANNTIDNVGYHDGVADIGLQNVIGLFTLAFSSLIPIMSISILPNITIGLLLFMPLIAGIIIAIIWIVKR